MGLKGAVGGGGEVGGGGGGSAEGGGRREKGVRMRGWGGGWGGQADYRGMTSFSGCSWSEFLNCFGV